MGFQFHIEDVIYVGPDDMVWPRTILVGTLVNGNLAAGDLIAVQTKTGLWTGELVGIETSRADVRTTLAASEPVGPVAVCLRGQPPDRSVRIGTVALPPGA